MNRDILMTLYRKLRLGTYRQIFRKIREKDGSLSATEAFSADVIHLLGKPTITQFASYLGISQPNATYKVNTLAQKGYVRKVSASADRREVRLETGEKYAAYLREDTASLDRAVEAIKNKYTDEEFAIAGRILSDLLQELEEKTA